MPFVSLNPATGKTIARHRAHSPRQLDEALATARTAQPDWARRPPARRAAVLRSLARGLRAQRDSLAALATAEMGKPVTQARAEVEKCALLCDYYAAQGETLLADQLPAGAPANARVVHEPLGTILAIMPWNFPFWQVVRAALPPLTAGNAVLLKPAPNVVGSTLALARVFDRAGFPAGLFQVILAGTGRTAALIADPRIHGVTLTGSTAAGKAVAALAGAAMKPGVFELGGSDPAIVLRDADLDHAAEICAQSRLLNSGQSCVCAKRFIVERAVVHDFTQRFVARIAARRVGDPTEPATAVGPLARADLRDHLDAQVRQSVRRGARVLLGGEPSPGPGFFYAPTVLADVRPGMAAADEELFGPVAAILTVPDAAAAVRTANASAYGLGATLFTRHRRRGLALARELEAGSVFINELVRSCPELPFGGVKASGYGRELGAWGAKAFVNIKTLWTA